MNFKIFFLFLSLVLWLAAEEALSSPLVDEPQGCYQDNRFPCSLVAHEGNLVVSRESLEFRMAPESVLEFKSPATVQILKGAVWVKSHNWLTLQFSTGLECRSKGDLLVQKDANGSVYISNLESEINFGKGQVFENESLPVGFENWFSPNLKNGAVSRGIIRPIDKAQFVSIWSRLSQLPLAESRKLIRRYGELWAPAVEEASQFYQEILQRRLASVEAADEKERLRKKRAEDERRAFRKMYRQKLSLEPEPHE